jgi:DNA-binding CsgD family transcriptional regulator
MRLPSHETRFDFGNSLHSPVTVTKPMGRPSKLTDAQKVEARRRRAQGATLAELARSYDVSTSTISRLTV